MKEKREFMKQNNGTFQLCCVCLDAVDFFLFILLHFCSVQQDSFLVEGIAFKKTFSYAGFEQQPKAFDEPLIVLLNVELELKNEKENAEIRLTDAQQYQAIVDAEWKIIYGASFSICLLFFLFLFCLFVSFFSIV